MRSHVSLRPREGAIAPAGTSLLAKRRLIWSRLVCITSVQSDSSNLRNASSPP